MTRVRPSHLPAAVDAATDAAADAAAHPSRFADDQVQVMRWQEITTYQTRDYLLLANGPREASGSQRELPCRSSRQQHRRPAPAVCKQWREVICEWAFKLVDYFGCPREVVGVAMHFVDRYLSSSSASSVMSKRQFKLLCLTCLHLALKTERPSIVSIGTLLSLSRDIFSPDQLIQMEQEVLHVLQWRLHPPTAFSFLGYYSMDIHQLDSAIVDTARFLVELSVIDYYFVHYRPSHVALGALLCSLEDAATTAHEQKDQQLSPLSSPSQQQLYLQVHRRILSWLDHPSERDNVWECTMRLRAIHKNVAPPPPSPMSVPSPSPAHPVQDEEFPTGRTVCFDSKELLFGASSSNVAPTITSSMSSSNSATALVRIISPVQVSAVVLGNAATKGDD